MAQIYNCSYLYLLQETSLPYLRLSQKNKRLVGESELVAKMNLFTESGRMSINSTEENYN